jgi:hypothetical protein
LEALEKVFLGGFELVEVDGLLVSVDFTVYPFEVSLVAL